MSAQTAQGVRAPQPAPAITPTLRSSGKRAAFWVIAGVGALVVALIAMVLSNASAVGGPPLGAENAAPPGGMALAEVLRSQGVDVIIADSLDAALESGAGDAGVTLFVSDPDDILDAGQIARLGAARHTVIVEPSFAYLQELAPEIGFGGVGADGPIAAGAGCEVAAAERAGSVSGEDGAALQTLSVPADAAGYTACFGDAATGASVLVQRDGRPSGETGAVTLVSDGAIFANASITSAGNAALALGLLGEQPTLVWYLPTLADVAAGTPSLAELTPGWVTPVMVLLVLCGIAAAIAYGRRFGPLVIENLPVTVRASETMDGRARLYARHSERLRAVDALRIATVGRIATALGLARTASLEEVVASAASVTLSDPRRVLATLLDDEPQSDAQMLALSDRLLDLERAVQAATRPGDAHSGTRHSSTHDSSTHDSSTERMEP